MGSKKKMIIKKLKKAALFTDFHIGAKNNSLTHLQDCHDYIDWFINNIKKDNNIDHIIFLGDWHDKRDSISILTINHSYECLKKLNNVGLKIYFMVGNHDIFSRHNSDLHSLVFFQEFENIQLIENITIIKETEIPILISPYLFPEQYINILKYQETKIAFLHPDFNGFVITGDTKIMEHGQNPDDYKMFDRIFCGHYHKRSNKGNISYIGNCFPHNYSDANDVERGFATYEYSTDKIEFHNWIDAPTYVKCNLSTLLENHKTMLRPKASVKCLDDEHITIEESIKIREKFIKKYNLREFFLEEETDSVSSDEDISLDGFELESTDVIVKELLRTKIDSDTLDSDKLVKIYEQVRAKR